MLGRDVWCEPCGEIEWIGYDGESWRELGGTSGDRGWELDVEEILR